MGDAQFYDMEGKIKLTHEKRGVPYTRKGYDLRATTAQRFAKKCALLGEPESRVVEKLVESFLTATGWGPDTKQGAFFEPRVMEHVKEASWQVVKDSIFG